MYQSLKNIFIMYTSVFLINFKMYEYLKAIKVRKINFHIPEIGASENQQFQF